MSKQSNPIRKMSAAFAAGLAAGMTEVNRVEAAAAGIAGAMAELTTDFGVKEYAELRAEWIKGYAEGFGCSEKRAENAWAESWRAACDAYGYVKPQSERAAAVQAKRAPQVAANKAAKADAKSRDAGNVQVVAPASGAKAAKLIKIEVVAIEAHIIDLFRRGKFADVIEIVQSEQAKAEAGAVVTRAKVAKEAQKAPATA